MSTSAIHEDGMGNLKPPVQPGKQLALSTKDEEIANEAPCLAEPAQTPTQLQFLPAEFLTTAIRLHEIRMTTFVKTKRPCDFQMISGCLAHHIPFNRLVRLLRPDNDRGFAAPDRVVRSQQVFAGGVDHLAARVDGEHVDDAF